MTGTFVLHLCMHACALYVLLGIGVHVCTCVDQRRDTECPVQQGLPLNPDLRDPMSPLPPPPPQNAKVTSVYTSHQLFMWLLGFELTSSSCTTGVLTH